MTPKVLLPVSGSGRSARHRAASWLEQLESRDHVLRSAWFQVAVIVGIGRFVEEALGVYLRRGDPLSLDAALNFVAFYALIVWAYTATTAVFTRQRWERTLGPAMLGALLGVVPPLMDIVIYGPGNFHYYYQFDYPHAVFGPIPVDLRRGIPLGEAVTAYASVGLLAGYVAWRSRSVGRTLLAALVGYELVHLWGSGVPTVAARLMPLIQTSLQTTISLVQILAMIAIYYGLNLALLRQALRRLPHALPASLLVLLGGVAARQPAGPIITWAVVAGLLAMIAMHHNDLYDQLKSGETSRPASPSVRDIRVLQAILALMLSVAAAEQVRVAACLLTFYLATQAYHHRLLRLKHRFPLNYLIEGLCAATMITAGMLATDASPAPWIPALAALAAFLGFALGSPFKDYKDIEEDQRAGNETVYTLALDRDRPVREVHLVVTGVVTLLTVIPVIWLRWRGMSMTGCVALGVLASVSLPTALITMRDRSAATRTGLWIVNGFLLVYALAAWRLGA